MNEKNLKFEPEEHSSGLNFRQEEININNIIGMFEVVDTAPTAKPTNLKNQIKIYRNGATKRLYWYDQVNDSWDYVSGT